MNDFDNYTTGALKTLLEQYANDTIKLAPEAVLKKITDAVPPLAASNRPVIDQNYMLQFLNVYVGQWVDPSYEFVEPITSLIRRATLERNLSDSLALKAELRLIINNYLKQAAKQDLVLRLEIAKTNLNKVIAQMKRFPAMYGDVLGYAERALVRLNSITLYDEAEVDFVGNQIAKEIRQFKRITTNLVLN